MTQGCWTTSETIQANGFKIGQWCAKRRGYREILELSVRSYIFVANSRDVFFKIHDWKSRWLKQKNAHCGKPEENVDTFGPKFESDAWLFIPPINFMLKFLLYTKISLPRQRSCVFVFWICMDIIPHELCTFKKPFCNYRMQPKQAENVCYLMQRQNFFPNIKFRTHTLRQV